MILEALHREQAPADMIINRRNPRVAVKPGLGDSWGPGTHRL